MNYTRSNNWIKNAAVAICLTAILSGCSKGYNWTPFTWGQDKGVEYGVALDSDNLIYRDTGAKIGALKRSNFTIDLIRFTDARIPENFENMVSDEVIYEYVPDKIMHGVGSYLAPTINHYLKYGKRKENIYKMEVELKRVRTFIRTGDFLSGPFGKYVAALEGDVVIRDEDSKVIMQTSIQVVNEEKRKAIDGSHPNMKQDRKAMMIAVRNGAKTFALKSAWGLRKNLGERGKYFDHSTPNDDIWEHLPEEQRLKKSHVN